MGSLSIKIETPQSREAWDFFLEGRDEGSFFYSWDWIELSAFTQPGNPYRILARDEEGHAIGIGWCLARKKSGVQLGVQPLLTPYSGIYVYPNARRAGEAYKKIFKAMRQQFSLIDLQIPTFMAPIVKKTRSNQRRNLIIRLRENDETETGCDFEIDFKKSTRRQIKKAQNNSDLRLVNTVNCEDIWRLTRETFEKRGTNCPIPRELVECMVISDQFKPYRDIFGIEMKGRLISCLITFSDPTQNTQWDWNNYGRRAYYAHAATDPEHLSTGASSWLVYESLRRAMNRGCHIFDFCGGNIPSIAKFKEGFGAVEERVPHLLWSKWPGLITLRNKFRRS